MLFLLILRLSERENNVCERFPQVLCIHVLSGLAHWLENQCRVAFYQPAGADTGKQYSRYSLLLAHVLWMDVSLIRELNILPASPFVE